MLVGICYKRLKIDLRIVNYSTKLIEHLNLKIIYYTILNHYLLRELMELIWRDKGLNTVHKIDAYFQLM